MKKYMKILICLIIINIIAFIFMKIRYKHYEKEINNSDLKYYIVDEGEESK